MTFRTREGSRTLGAPLTLYRFTLSNAVYAYTDAERPISFGGVTYNPLPIDRDSVKSSGTLDKAQLSITVPRDCDVAELFRVFPPSEVVGVTIFQGHDGDPDNEFLAVYSGRVVSSPRAPASSEATLLCEPINTSMRRVGLRRRYQYGCPHPLYSQGDGLCNAVRSQFTWERTVIAINGAQITLEAGWENASTHSAVKFIGGIFEYSVDGRVELRTILRATFQSQLIVIDGLPRGLAVGDRVKVSLGCNHKGTNGGDCSAVFNNIVNFGGQENIPLENPVGFVNRFF